jgi:hypothetical protein
MRCRACNKALTSAEIIWYPKEMRHEDLCGKCRSYLLVDLAKGGECVEAHEEYIDGLLGDTNAKLPKF